MAIFNSVILYGDYFGHYDGTNLYFDADFGFGGVVDFAEYNNKLYAGTEDSASLYGSTDGINWSLVLDGPNNTYALWTLEPFQGQLYLGYDNGQLGYMNSSETWNSVLTVSNSIISMAAAENAMLYFGIGLGAVGDVEDGTGPGYVYAYSGNGATNAALISGPMGAGVQRLDYLAGALFITPSAGFDAEGCVGGPFSITNETFSLLNTGTNSLTWSLANTPTWLNASPGGGTLTPGETTNVTVSLNSNANSMTAGVYTATVFANLGQSRQFTLTVIGPPVITCPSNITVTTTNPAGAVVNYTVTVSGGSPPITTNCEPPSGSVFPIGTNIVHCCATDCCGQSNCCSFPVTVSPLPLSITCPSDIVMTTPNPGWAVINYNVTVSGGCPPYTTNCVPTNGSVFTNGTTTVNCYATDSCGQSNCCNFRVTVNVGPLPALAQLLAGTSGYGGAGEGMVYAYQGGTSWTAISTSLGDAVLDIIQFDGALYAATTSYDYNGNGNGQVWRYNGGASWTVVGDNMDQGVYALEIYNGQLYAGHRF